ncbi:hypothetical protein BDQ17DRAFT_1371646 [Cyathus striatus]|nr:hypothetical protein BDQ17DRAFT_1371646 [Cyathus striatus]
MWYIPPYTMIVLKGLFFWSLALYINCLSVLRALWWDDYFVLLATCGEFLFLILLIIEATNAVQLPAYQGARYWIGIAIFIFINWYPGTGIARIFPSTETMHKLGVFMALFFFGLGSIISIWVFVACRDSSLWVISTVLTYCDAPRPWKFLFLTIRWSACFCPFNQLWNVNLPRLERRLVLSGFAASTLSSLASAVSMVFQFAPANWEPQEPFITYLNKIMQTSVTVIVCNTLVLVAYLYSHSWRDSGNDSTVNESHTQPTTDSDQHTSQ